MNYSRIARILCILIVLILAVITAGMCEEAANAYKLGPEDTVSVAVARHPELSGDFLIPSDGALSLPGVGQVNANGKTLSDLADEVTAGLRNRLREPEVVVTLKTPRMQRVYVLGSINRPGLYDMKPEWRITEALAAAGGLEQELEAADSCVTVLRAATGQREQVSMVDVLRGAAEANLPVSSGDVVTVEAVETIPIYVMGRVKNPGLYKLRKDSTRVMEALTLAGGTLEDAAVDRVTITRVSGESETVNLVPAIIDGKQEGNADLRPGDLVVVPEETARVAVLGYVNQPGFYPMKNGQKLTLSDALGFARGADNKRGNIGSIAVIRIEGDKQTREIYNLQKFLKNGDSSQNPEIKAGDVVFVPQTGKPDWDFVIRSLSAIGILLNPFY